ncbi:MAG: hypothetical protein D6743_03965 [Calditrichaeota bacterium]|nr:MAG: hypothetical protein D6743_03965 [Calditrichota bacterium]
MDYWDPWVAVHDDELDGRFHSNTEINVRQSNGIKPKFRGKVTTSSYEINTSGSPFLDEKAVFLGGLETGVKAINLPKHFLPFESDTTIGEEQMQRFEDETRIVFRGDGTFSWEVLKGNGGDGHRKLPQKAFYIIGKKGRPLHVEGVVRGKVLVYSPSKIIIDGDLTYAHHPEVSFAADDYLGLVSKKDIEVGPPAATGPGDLYIFASIYARGRFRVKDRRGNNDATMYIYGSLTAGSLSATEPRYATHVRFDKRLEQNRPPSFPMTDRFEVTDWNQKWEVKGN